jgi:hypothetical protein
VEKLSDLELVKAIERISGIEGKSLESVRALAVELELVSSEKVRRMSKMEVLTLMRESGHI